MVGSRSGINFWTVLHSVLVCPFFFAPGFSRTKSEGSPAYLGGIRSNEFDLDGCCHGGSGVGVRKVFGPDLFDPCSSGRLHAKPPQIYRACWPGGGHPDRFHSQYHFFGNSWPGLIFFSLSRTVPRSSSRLRSAAP